MNNIYDKSKEKTKDIISRFKNIDNIMLVNTNNINDRTILSIIIMHKEPQLDNIKMVMTIELAPGDSMPFLECRVFKLYTDKQSCDHSYKNHVYYDFLSEILVTLEDNFNQTIIDKLPLNIV